MRNNSGYFMTADKTIDHAFITAAGRGERMKPLTDECCKPMVLVQGKPIIGHVLDRLWAAGVRHIGVNSFYKPEGLESYLQHYQAEHAGLHITVMRETTLLDTGGGIKNGLASMPDKPFFIVSGDSYWEDNPGTSALTAMAQKFDAQRMDMLFLLRARSKMTVTAGAGDYDIEPDGKIVRSLDQSGQYVWTSVRIIKNKALFNGSPEGPFSFRLLMDEAQHKNRLYGHIHEGEWHHFSTAADVEAVNNLLKEKDCA